MANKLSCKDDGESGSEEDIIVLVLNGFIKGIIHGTSRGSFLGLPLFFISNSPLPPTPPASQPVTHSRRLNHCVRVSSKLGEGTGNLKEWVPLQGEYISMPTIRIAHPVTSTRFDGKSRKRKAAVVDYSWLVGDRVDVQFSHRLYGSSNKLKWALGDVYDFHRVYTCSMVVTVTRRGAGNGSGRGNRGSRICVHWSPPQCGVGRSAKARNFIIYGEVSINENIHKKTLKPTGPYVLDEFQALLVKGWDEYRLNHGISEANTSSPTTHFPSLCTDLLQRAIRTAAIIFHAYDSEDFVVA
ncbi:hypothetical protein POM88_027955 [Heracleum sosnowskyi]|uniref:Uncharacterized protein n=1 Tax=Heracleum sosnowskyi TaxID=360622 RepID=A0AAD8MQ08_9APIA|nr:hypothetical protein POM88_027955 [Heracleum sosnowskyi]